MTTTDWIVDIALVLMVVRQLREEKLSRRFVIIPIAIVAYVAHKYLHTIPTQGNDLLLLGACIGLGLLLGIAGGLLTRVRAAQGVAYVRAGAAAATLWIVSMTARLLFIVWITHGAGAHHLAHFSAAHDITSGLAWQDALVLLALSEVAARIGIIVLRGHTLATRPGGHHPTPVTA